MNIDLGRVIPIYRSAYSDETAYELNDIVLYNGNLYWHCSATPTTGVPPTDATVWESAFAGDDLRQEVADAVEEAQQAKSDAQAAAQTAVSQVTATALEVTQQATAAIQAEGQTQVVNVQAAAEEITGKAQQIDQNAAGISELKSDLGAIAAKTINCYLDSSLVDYSTPRYYLSINSVKAPDDGIFCYVASPITLKAGTYYFRNIWGYFSWYQSGNTSARLTTSTIVHNLTCTFDNDVTVYCTARNTQDVGVIDGDADYDIEKLTIGVLDFQNANGDSLDSVRKDIDDIQRINDDIQRINDDGVGLENVKNRLVVLDEINSTSYRQWYSSSGSDLTSDPMHIVQATGNSGIYGAKNLSADMNHTMVTVYFELSQVTKGGVKLYLYGKSKTSDSWVFTNLGSAFSEAGTYAVNIDLAYYDVYSNIDVSCYSVLIVNAGDTDLYIGNIKIGYVETNLFDPGTNLVQIIDSLKNEIVMRSSENDEHYLVSPDGDKYVMMVANDGTINGAPVIPNKVLFIGNSLLLGHGTYGMCAADENHDYYHYITAQITKSNPAAVYTKLSGTAFEGYTTESNANNWMVNTLSAYLDADLDLIIVQLGDNVNTDDKVSAFAITCKQLLQYLRTNCPKARVVWVGEWYSSAEKQTIISDACQSTGSVFISIVDLVTTDNKAKIGDVTHRESSISTTYTVDSYTDDPTNKLLTINFTISSVNYSSVIPYESYVDNGDGTITITGYYVAVTSAGVASHPGNAGMLAIANRICYKLGITASETDIAEA